MCSVFTTPEMSGSDALQDKEEDQAVEGRPHSNGADIHRYVRSLSKSRVHRLGARLTQSRRCRFPNIYVFQYFNMRNDKLKELREQLLDSSKYICSDLPVFARPNLLHDVCAPFVRFCLGSTKVMKVALGHNPDQEQRPNLALLAECIRGNVGLFFTRLPRDKVAARPELLSCSAA